MRTKNPTTQPRATSRQGLLDQLLQGQIAVRVLRYLTRAGGDHTGRALARAAGASPGATLRALRELVRHELVEQRTAGRAILYKLNTDHWLVDTGIGPLFEAEAALFPEIGRAISKWVRTPVAAIIVYGSVAHGTATPNSEIDLLCVTPSEATRNQAEQEFDAIATRFRRRFAHPLSYFVWSKQTLRKRYTARDPLAQTMVNTGQIILGDSLVEMLQ